MGANSWMDGTIYGYPIPTSFGALILAALFFGAIVVVFSNESLLYLFFIAFLVVGFFGVAAVTSLLLTGDGEMSFMLGAFASLIGVYFSVKRFWA